MAVSGERAVKGGLRVKGVARGRPWPSAANDLVRTGVGTQAQMTEHVRAQREDGVRTPRTGPPECRWPATL